MVLQSLRSYVTGHYYAFGLLQYKHSTSPYASLIHAYPCLYWYISFTLTRSLILTHYMFHLRHIDVISLLVQHYDTCYTLPSLVLLRVFKDYLYLVIASLILAVYPLNLPRDQCPSLSPEKDLNCNGNNSKASG